MMNMGNTDHIKIQMLWRDMWIHHPIQLIDCNKFMFDTEY